MFLPPTGPKFPASPVKPVFSGKKHFSPPVLQPDLYAPWAPNTPGIKRFAVIGDAGSGNHRQEAIAKEMSKAYGNTPFASVLVLGDNVYEDGEPHLFEERIYEPYKDLFKKGVRFFPVMGNHDVRRGYQNQQMHYWGSQPFYSVKQGNVEFFAIDTTLMLPGYEDCYKNQPHFANKLNETQMVWLEKALAASAAKFKVVYGHYPLYSSGAHAKDKDTTLKLRGMLEPLFTKHGVDVYLAGHDHHYERSKPLKGVLHFVSGAAGKIRQIFFADKAPYPREKAMVKSHFMLFEASNNQLSYKVISRKGKDIDSGVITKSPQSRIA